MKNVLPAALKSGKMAHTSNAPCLVTEPAHAGPLSDWRHGGPGGDVLMLSRHLTCTTTAAIEALGRFLSPPPRRVHLVLSRAADCNAAERLLPGDRLRCHDEDRVLPMNRSHVAALLEASGRRPRPADSALVGWMWQQFVKLGFGLFNQISETHLVWDADAVLIAPHTPLCAGALHLFTGGYNAGPFLNNTYGRAFRALLDEELQQPPGGKRAGSLVTHHALFHQPWVAELLGRIATGRRCDGAATCLAAARGMEWAARIIGVTGRRKHFSEYSFYLSWVLLHHPEQRVRFGRRRALRIRAPARPATQTATGPSPGTVRARGAATRSRRSPPSARGRTTRSRASGASGSSARSEGAIEYRHAPGATPGDVRAIAG